MNVQHNAKRIATAATAAYKAQAMDIETSIALASLDAMLADMRAEKQAQAKAALDKEIDGILDDLLTPSPGAYVSYVGAWGERIDCYHLPKPIVVSHKRVGHRMTRTMFVY